MTVDFFRNIKKFHLLYRPNKFSAISSFYSKANTQEGTLLSYLNSNRVIALKSLKLILNIFYYSIRIPSTYCVAFLYSSIYMNKKFNIPSSQKLLIYLKSSNSLDWVKEYISNKIISSIEVDDSLLPLDVIRQFYVRPDEIISYLILKLKIVFFLPIIKGFLFESINEKFIELNSFYLLKWFVIGKRVHAETVYFQYEDITRDRMLIYQLKKRKIKTEAILTTPGHHLYRPNMHFTEGDIIKPDKLTFLYPERKLVYFFYKENIKSGEMNGLSKIKTVSIKVSKYSVDTILLAPSLVANDEKLFLDLYNYLKPEISSKIHIKIHPYSKYFSDYPQNLNINFATTLLISSNLTNYGFYQIDKFQYNYLTCLTQFIYDPFNSDALPMLAISSKELIEKLISF